MMDAKDDGSPIPLLNYNVGNNSSIILKINVSTLNRVASRRCGSLGAACGQCVGLLSANNILLLDSQPAWGLLLHTVSQHLANILQATANLAATAVAAVVELVNVPLVDEALASTAYTSAVVQHACISAQQSLNTFYCCCCRFLRSLRMYHLLMRHLHQLLTPVPVVQHAHLAARHAGLQSRSRHLLREWRSMDSVLGGPLSWWVFKQHCGIQLTLVACA